VEVDRHSKEPSYAQVARQLREQIMSGELGPRDQLPSLKRLMQETGLAQGTVQHAIGVLEAEGIVYTVSGRGTFVVPEDQRPGR
jgi:GntR family transcriptional regulator